ncbi:MAG: hypothetical protein L0H31_16440, partial [Nocardioidaceae bacterium]|nr:hypothetical protein [Nocardioidaceae bacterium]
MSVATSLHGTLGDLTARMSERLSETIDDLDGEGAIAALLHASVEGNVENILNALRLDIMVENLEPPSAAFEYARRLAQRGVAVSDLVRAYRLGQQDLLAATFTECARHDATPEIRAAAYQAIVTLTFDYIDWISQGVVTVYETERERWLAERSSARVSRVEELIAGNTSDVDGAESVIGYRLRVAHLGAVLWVHDKGAQQDQVSRFTRAVGAIADYLEVTRAPLIVPRDRASAWAWFPVAESTVIQADAIRSILIDAGGLPVPMVAFGQVQTGPIGFRRTHLQALQAQQVATIRDDLQRPVLSFDEPGLKVAALLAGELDNTRTWVQETLGTLARDDEQHERLRQTMMLFLQHDSNYTATAEAMLMHKNSVKYR